MGKKLILSFLIFSFLLIGCTSSGTKEEAPELKNMFGDPNSFACPPVSDPDNPCMCYICTQHVPNFIEATYTKSSILGETCKIQKCNNDTYLNLIYDYIEAPQYVQEIPRFFEFGAGPTFNSFDQANSFCNYKLGLPVRWLTAKTEDDDMPLPSAGQAACYLERNVAPLYILYQKEGRIDAGRSGQIASRLNSLIPGPLGREIGGVGPAYIATQPNYEKLQANLVKDQIDAIDSECEKCQVVFSLRETEADEDANSSLKEILGQPPLPGQPNTPIYEKVDFVGLGIQITPESIAGKGCNVQREILEKIKFTYSQVLIKYRKPSLWTYFLISTGSSGSCTITPQMAADGYDYLYKNAQFLAYSGIVGVALEKFSDASSQDLTSLPPDSQAGLLDFQEAQKHPQLNYWVDNCRYYYGADKFYPPISAVYSPEGRANYCGFTYNGVLFNGVEHNDPGLEVALSDEDNKYSCSSCISSSPPPSDFYSGEIPPAPGSLDDSFCTAYQELEINAGKFSLDPLLARAVSAVESGIVGQKVICERDIIGVIPKSGCWSSSVDAENPDYPAPRDACPSPNLGAKCGLMGLDENYGEGTEKCAGSNYNPFNPSNNACLGSQKLSEVMNDPELNRLIEENSEMLGIIKPDGTVDKAKKEWMPAYLSLAAYYGNGISTARDAINGFKNQYFGDSSLSCSGEKNFLNYLSQCTYDKYGNVGIAKPKQVIAYYEALKNKCGSSC